MHCRFSPVLALGAIFLLANSWSHAAGPPYHATP
jgi:hypothetical protein